ncbi:MAG: hypothetical protein JJU09_09070 [Rhodobacteraceae bacterium]|nr:hypothetical protein [Paracoccaceae bacterium]
MSRHLIDQPRDSHTGNIGQFIRIARSLLPQMSPRKMLARKRNMPSQRAAAFATLERKRDA